MIYNNICNDIRIRKAQILSRVTWSILGIVLLEVITRSKSWDATSYQIEQSQQGVVLHCTCGAVWAIPAGA